MPPRRAVAQKEKSCLVTNTRAVRPAKPNMVTRPRSGWRGRHAVANASKGTKMMPGDHHGCQARYCLARELEV